MRTRCLASLLGYDPRLLLRLPMQERAALDWFSASVMFACVISCLPLGYAVWLATHQIVLTGVLTLASGALFWALVRLSVAAGPYLMLAGKLSARGPWLLLAVTATLGAQPAQLLLARAEQAPLVAAHRSMLVARHAALSGCDARTPCDRYHERIAACDFVALRLQVLWSRPGEAMRATLLYVCIVLLPGLIIRLLATRSLRRYERLRLVQARKIVRDAAASARTARARALTAYPSYAPRTSEHDPLRIPWKWKKSAAP